MSSDAVDLDPTQDWHTHSDWSLGVDSPPRMLAAAEAAGLRSWGLSDVVGQDTPWLADYTRTVRALGSKQVHIRCGVQTALLDLRGGLDLPARLPRLDYVLIAHHRMPGAHGPVAPSAVVEDIARGRRTVASVAADVVTATVSAVRASPFPPVVGKLLSVLAKCGLTQADVTDEMLDTLVRGLRGAQAAVALGERSRVLSPRIVRALADGGVRLVAGSEARRAEDVGRRN